MFRDVYAQMGLKRDGHDLPDAYLIPTLSRAMGEVVDPARTMALLAAERERLPDRRLARRTFRIRLHRRAGGALRRGDAGRPHP
ncbi:hypothetical protein ACFSTI_11525 [Rhizorhabdus histidinilytica]